MSRHVLPDARPAAGVADAETAVAKRPGSDRPEADPTAAIVAARSAGVAGGSASRTVTLVSAVVVRHDRREAHRQLHEAAVAHAAGLGGLVRAELIPAIEGVQPQTVALLTFDNRAALDRWLNAPQRHHALAAMSELTDGDRTLTVVGDFAGCFTTSATAGTPPRWKQAVVVLCGLIPVSIAVAVAREHLAPGLPAAAAAAGGSVINVAALTWFVMPAITRAARRWLETPQNRTLPSPNEENRP